MACGSCGLNESSVAARSCGPDGKGVAEVRCPGLAIVTEHHRGRTVLRLRGELDAGNTECLRRAIGSALKHHPQVLVIDLSAVDFADCGSLAVLVRAHRHLAELGRDLLVAGGQPTVIRLMHLTGLDTCLHLGGRLGGGGT